jgi:hypothetical protein
VQFRSIWFFSFFCFDDLFLFVFVIDSGWTQKDLAQAINEKPQVVAAYESPTAKTITNHAIISKMERALGTKLRGD